MAEAKQKLTVVAYGDSWTYGSVSEGWKESVEAGLNPALATGSWVSQFTRWLQQINPQHAVHNEGKPGWRSVQGRDHFTELVASHQPDVLILNFGINDWKGGVDLPTYRSAMEDMILQAKRIPCECILWTSGPVSTSSGEAYGWEHPVQDDHFQASFDQFNDTLRDLAAKHGLILADIEQKIIKEWRDGFALSKHFYDAIHFTQWGHDYIFGCMKSVMLSYPHLTS